MAILVDEEKLYRLVTDLLREERSDVPIEYHERDARILIEECKKSP